VENLRDVAATVYLEEGQFDRRLGIVPSETKEILQLPEGLRDGEQIQVVVKPEGESELTSGDLEVKFGSNLDILVPEQGMGVLSPVVPETIPEPPQGSTTVTVNNDYSVPVTVYIENGDFDTRIGSVPSKDEETLMIPDRLTVDGPEGMESVAIFVHPEGGLDMASHIFELKPGAHLLLKVPNA